MPGAIKTVLFILHSAPYGSSTARETLDAALAAAAFEQNVQLLFIGDGVWHLLPNQQADALASKDTGKMLQALGYYDISDVYVDSVSLEERQLTGESLAITAKVLDKNTLQEIVRKADCVISL